jgi:cytidine deaminase
VAGRASKDGGDAREARDGELLAQAAAVLENAYSPYSNVRVGAALRAVDGRVFAGCNVENASFGLTICAERNALFAAVASGARDFEALAVVTDRDRGWMPCGACRQTLHELAPRLRILIRGRSGAHVVTSLPDLLPDAFDPDALL